MKKTEQRIRDEQAMRFSGLLGHAFQTVIDHPEEANRSWVCGEYGDLSRAMRTKPEGARIYRIKNRKPRKYDLVG